ncbi:hypothetical protein RE6C_01098 [Rhodopirellula europaea 6C]|uniref:Uncharacterized protein n=1 Tax=Rhodopirellula europaea 6C TaxID=1263867 RepID=M2B7I4_9BACT|nr:hypothetical protein RE6C_01098 [Rhodopirellula europaea 6C]
MNHSNNLHASASSSWQFADVFVPRATPSTGQTAFCSIRSAFRRAIVGVFGKLFLTSGLALQ